MQEDPNQPGSRPGPQADEMTARVARNEADIEVLRKEADGDRHRIEALEARALVDKAMLEELRAEGIVNRDHAANLQVALQSARLIGAAVGIVMARRTVNEVVGFEILKKASQDTNRKLRTVAEEVVLTGDVSRLPPR